MATRAPLGLIIFQFVLWGLLLAAAALMIVPRFMPDQRVTAHLAPGVPLNLPFSLIDQDGKAVTEAAFEGKPAAWFYGFTNCPDVCPTALSELSALLTSLGPDADRLAAVFVTVDPERDTAAVMKQYVEYFDPRIVGLTGELPAVEAMVRSRYVQFAKIPQESGDGYVMQHSASIYLTNSAGEFVGTLDPEEALSVKLEKLKRLIANA